MTSRPHAHTDVRVNATPHCEVSLAFCQMATGTKKPHSVAWYFHDIRRGRLQNPLGAYEKVSEVLARAGASYYWLARPALSWLGTLRRICNSGASITMKDAITNAEKEGSEARVTVTHLALTVNCPDTRVLDSAEKELVEEIEAKKILVEKIEDKRAEMQQPYAEKR